MTCAKYLLRFSDPVLDVPELLSKALQSSPFHNQLNGNRQVLKTLKSTPENKENGKRLFSSLQKSCSMPRNKESTSKTPKQSSCDVNKRSDLESNEDEDDQPRECASQVPALLVSFIYIV